MGLRQCLCDMDSQNARLAPSATVVAGGLSLQAHKTKVGIYYELSEDAEGGHSLEVKIGRAHV